MTEKRRGLVLGGVAAVLNAGGRAVVFLTEMSSGALGGVASAAKNVVHVPQKVAGLFGSEAKHLEEQIHAFERKIKLNYYEIGKESAHSENIESAPQGAGAEAHCRDPLF